jgi:hypothetical protein
LTEELIQEAEIKIEDLFHYVENYNKTANYDEHQDIQLFLSGCGAR